MLLPLPYRRVSVQDSPVTLTHAAIVEHLLGKEAYRRTDYVVLVRGAEIAIAAIATEDRTPLFSPISEVELVALPGECVWVDTPDVDTSNPSQMALLAEHYAFLGKRAVVVRGQHEHVNFVVDAALLTIRVLDVVPPYPAKLLAQAQAVLDYAEDLPAIRLVPDAVDLHDLARLAQGRSVVFPCRAGAISLDVPVDFLDQRPRDTHAVLVGCQRSEQFYRHYYGRDPVKVDTCPKSRPLDNRLCLMKCCLLERGLEEGPGYVVVPWGATRSEVAAGLHRLVQMASDGVESATQYSPTASTADPQLVAGSRDRDE